MQEIGYVVVDDTRADIVVVPPSAMTEENASFQMLSTVDGNAVLLVNGESYRMLAEDEETAVSKLMNIAAALTRQWMARRGTR